MAVTTEVDKVLKEARSEAIGRVTVAKPRNGRLSISIDRKNGRIVVTERAVGKSGR